MAAIIQIHQPAGAGPGVAGVGRNDLWKDQPVELTCPDTHSQYYWQILDAPPESVAAIDDPTAQTCHYTPDYPNSYRIQLTVDSGGAGNSSIRIAAVSKDSTGTLLNRGWRLPASDEQVGESNWNGNIRGYSPDFEYIINDLLANGFGGGSGGGNLLIYWPAGSAAGNVYTDWSLLMAARALMPGPVDVCVINAFPVSALIPVTGDGSPWDMDNVRLLGLPGYPNGRGSAIEFQDGACFTNCHYLQDLSVASVSNWSAFVTLGSEAILPMQLVNCYLMGGPNVALIAPGIVPFSAYLVRTVLRAVDEGPPVIDAGTSGCSLLLEAGSTISEDALYTAPVTGTAISVSCIDVGSVCSTEQLVPPATLTITLQPASRLSYDDGTAPALSATNVQDAIDALKVRAPAFGGDLGDWLPPSTTQQRVIGLNTVALPTGLPQHGDLLRARADLMISAAVADMTYDGANLLVADQAHPGARPAASPLVYGGIARFPLAPGAYFDARFDYEENPHITPAGAVLSVEAYEDYLYALVVNQDNAGLGTLVTSIYKIDPDTGAVVASEPIVAFFGVYEGRLRIAEGCAWVLTAAPDAAEVVVVAIELDDLTQQHSIITDTAWADKVDLAHDTSTGKTWIVVSGAANTLYCVDTLLRTIDFFTSPGPVDTFYHSVATGDGYVWLSTSKIGVGMQVFRINPADGSYLSTVTDGSTVVTAFDRMAHDASTHKLWCLSNDGGTVGPSLVRVTTAVPASAAVEAITSLDTDTNVALAVAGGYAWVLDAPYVPVIPNTLLRITPASMAAPASSAPWAGVTGRYTRGVPHYELSSGLDVENLSAGGSTRLWSTPGKDLILAAGSQQIVLPTEHADGKVVTVLDATSTAGVATPLVILDEVSTVSWTIMTSGGAISLMWSEALRLWVEV